MCSRKTYELFTAQATLCGLNYKIQTQIFLAALPENNFATVSNAAVVSERMQSFHQRFTLRCTDCTIVPMRTENECNLCFSNDCMCWETSKTRPTDTQYFLALNGLLYSVWWTKFCRNVLITTKKTPSNCTILGFCLINWKKHYIFSPFSFVTVLK